MSRPPATVPSHVSGSISNRTLIVSADSKRVLAVLNGRDPLLLPLGSVLQFGHPLGELVVTRVRVIVSEGGGIVCVETEPEPGRRRTRQARATPRSDLATCGRCRASYSGGVLCAPVTADARVEG